jgi:LysR family transcriptional regulator of gallate degradation
MLLTAAGEVVRLRADRIEAELYEVYARKPCARERNGSKVGGIEALLNERRLQAAALLAEVHHMPSVAHAMGVAVGRQPGRIARLEDMLGQPLFLRTAHGMLPTDAGRRWSEALRAGAGRTAPHPGRRRRAGRCGAGVVTIGALPLARSQLLPMAIASVLKRHPRLHIRSLESPYGELTAGLLSGRIDFIVGALRAAPATPSIAPLFEDKAALVARSGHPLAAKKG